METKKITISERIIRAYINNPQVYQLRDKNQPLVLRFNKARSGGSWYAVNYKKGHKRFTKIGNYPLISASLAKRVLPDYLAGKEKRSIDHFVTIGDLLLWHLERSNLEAGMTDGRKRQIKVAINKHLLPALGNIEIKQANKKLILESLIKPMQEKYKVSTIKNTFIVLRCAALNANELEMIEECKLLLVNFKDFKLKKPEVRQALLSLGDMPDLIAQLNGYAVTMEKTLVLMMLYHGTRISETAMAEWKHIDLKNRVWSIPAKNTKTKQAIKIPITPHAYALLKDWHKELIGNRRYKGRYIFPSTIRTHKRDSPISEPKRHELIKLVSGGLWTAHDTRKCCATSWLEMGFDFFIIECQLNHSKNTQIGAYFQTEIFKRREALLEHWHKFLNF
ncbi:integrase/recombinase [Vibrio phage 282E43-1]|nr:integrase/recombinase [Vibrio phage 282E43-1]